MKTPLQFFLQNDSCAYNREINAPKGHPQMHLCDNFAEKLLGRLPQDGEKFLFELSTQPFSGAKQIYARGGVIGNKGQKKWVMGMPFEPYQMTKRLGKQFDTQKEKRFYVKLSSISDFPVKEVLLKKDFDWSGETCFCAGGESAICLKAIEFFFPQLKNKSNLVMRISGKPFEGSLSVNLKNNGGRLCWEAPEGYFLFRRWPANFYDGMISLIKSLPDFSPEMKTLYFSFSEK